MAFVLHLFRHHRPFYYKDHSGSSTHGLFRAVGCSVVLWLLAAALVLLLVTTYYPDIFAVQPITMIGQSSPPEGSLQEEEYCDLTDGTWVRNREIAPPYTNVSCPTMPDSKNCGKYGKDMDYLNWSWKPRRCELPAFDVKLFLEMVRGKSMGFVGDSVARNQYESLLCLLSQVKGKHGRKQGSRKGPIQKRKKSQGVGLSSNTSTMIALKKIEVCNHCKKPGHWKHNYPDYLKSTDKGN